MRTTLRLDPHLLTEAKKVAQSSGRTLSSVVEDALRESLARRRTPRAAQIGKLPTYRGQGLRPGVNLDDSAALLELMHDRATTRVPLIALPEEFDRELAVLQLPDASRKLKKAFASTPAEIASAANAARRKR
jgi:hypothetical protein